MIAKFIKDLDGFTGEAKLFRLDPPFQSKGWDDEQIGPHEYVVVSATVAMFSGPETYMFPADEEGNVTDWAELPGSFKGGMSRKVALQNAGYTVEG